MKVIIPAEEELGQSGFQILCFLTHAAQADFIAPDAMAKLRQVQSNQTVHSLIYGYNGLYSHKRQNKFLYRDNILYFN